MHSIKMQMVVDGELTIFNPTTTAANVELEDGTTVQNAITALQSTVSTLNTDLSALTDKVNKMYDKLDFDTVYMTNNDGEVLTDGSGTNLVAVY